MRSNTAKALVKEWGINVSHAVYRKDGTWFHHLTSFPGALIDEHGYVIVDTEETYRALEASGYLRLRVEVSAPKGIAVIPGYVRVIDQPVGSDMDLLEPTADPAKLDARVQALRKRAVVPRPASNLAAPSSVMEIRTTYLRRPDVKAWVLQEAHGTCELCRRRARFRGDDGELFLEVHHVRPLADGGPDTVENAVALCPTCHRWLHYGSNRLERREQLYNQVSRLMR